MNHDEVGRLWNGNADTDELRSSSKADGAYCRMWTISNLLGRKRR